MKHITPSYRRGFTIPEMLAVVAIIVIVLSILLPSFAKTKLVTHDALCKNNLHQIHMAYTSRNVDVKRQSVKQFQPFGWAGALSSYLNGEKSMYICQTGIDSTTGSTINNSGGDVFLRVYNSYPNGYLYDMSMVAGPLTRQVDKSTSDATIDALWSKYPDIAATIKSLRNNLPNDSSYLLCFEDLRPDGGDLDFEDVIFQLSEEENGVNIKFLYDGAGYQFDLVQSDGTVKWKQLDNGGQTKPGHNETFEGAPTDYGITDQITNRFHGGKNVIFMLDYERTVANCAGSSGIDPWNDWLTPQGVERFARHWNKANCMFFDGGVRLMDPVTIKPTILQNRIDYWIP